MIIAIDGPAASGKGTLAKRLAQRYGFHFLDTGLLYRVVANETISQGYLPEDPWAALGAARTLKDIFLDKPKLRTIEAGEKASIVASFNHVRQELLKYQRTFAQKKPGVILDGRDIGTIVLPQADVKLFVTASPETRAKRRFVERKNLGECIIYEDILKEVIARDKRDQTRQIAPLKPASDALLLDTTDLDIETVFNTAVQLIERKIGH